MSAYFHLKPSGTQYMFNLKSPGNGETVLTSERYTTRQSALNGINSVRANAQSDVRYARLTSTSGQPYFVLKGANGEPIGTSEMYSSTANRDNGIAWVKANAPTAEVRE
jgi:uncharacterized protein YegP (UPF0339 family)